MVEQRPVRIGDAVRTTRLGRGMTQQALALRLGTSRSAVARIEQGRQNLSM